MIKRKNYPFKHRNDWVGRVLVALGLAPRHKHMPVFGIQAAGKSYFIMSVAYFISMRKLGRVVGVSADFVNHFIELMMRREKLDATPGYRDFDIEVDRVYATNYEEILSEVPYAEPAWNQPLLADDLSEREKDGETIPADFLISTNDLSGEQFKNAMRRLSEPTARLGEDPQIRQFLQILDNGEGAIVVVDVVRRDMGPDEFRQNRVAYVREALAEQVVPLVRGIQLSIMKGNKQNKVFPLFLVFTKRDVHQYSRSELDQVVKEVFAILLAGLEDHIEVRIHSVQNVGLGVDPESILDLETQSEGIGLFLADLSYWVRQM